MQHLSFYIANSKMPWHSIDAKHVVDNGYKSCEQEFHLSQGPLYIFNEVPFLMSLVVLPWVDHNLVKHKHEIVRDERIQYGKQVFNP